MADTLLAEEPPVTPTGTALLDYVEDMVLELAHMAAGGGETALAASLAIVAVQCGARREGRR